MTKGFPINYLDPLYGPKIKSDLSVKSKNQTKATRTPNGAIVLVYAFSSVIARVSLAIEFAYLAFESWTGDYNYSIVNALAIAIALIIKSSSAWFIKTNNHPAIKQSKQSWQRTIDFVFPINKIGIGVAVLLFVIAVMGVALQNN